MNNITAVFCSRNDSKDPNFPFRFITTVNNLTTQYDEVIYVDYASEHTPVHKDLQTFINKTGKLRCITITPEDAAQISPFGNTKFIEVYARNIGIRRARSNWIISTNQDVVSDRPVELDSKTMYTVARHNVPENYFLQVDSENSLKWLKENKGSFTVQPDAIDSAGNPTWDPGDRWSLVVSCGDYQIAHRDVWYSIKGFEESMIYRSYADSNIMKKASMSFDIRKLDLDIFHLDHPVNPSANYTVNDRIKYVVDFSITENPETWGFSNISFTEEVI